MKTTILFILTILSFSFIYGQTDSTKTKSDSIATKATTQSNHQNSAREDMRPLKDRIALGFGTGFWITPNQTYIEVAPVLAYMFPKALITGIGYRYIYRHNRIYGIDLNSWGPDFFLRLQLLKRVYFWSEYEILNNQYIPTVAGQELATKEKTTTDSWFAGLGYIRSMGKKGRGGLSIQVLYNFLYSKDDISPYYSPVTYRVGYFF